jgi:hypothetical protein
MKEGQFVNLIRKKRCAGYGAYLLVLGALEPREFPVDFNFLRLFPCKTLLPHMTYLFCVDTNTVLPPNIFHTQVLKAAIEETCSYTYVYTVRILMEVPVYWLGGFE